MIFSSFSMQEPQVLQVDYHPSLSFDSYDIDWPYEEPPSFFDAICYPCPLLDADSSLQEGFFHGSVPSSYRKDEVDFTSSPWSKNGPTEEAYDEDEQLPNSGHWNWLSEYDSCFGDCCGDNLFYSTDDNGYGSSLANSFHSEGQFDSYISDYEDMENHPSYDYNPWYQSWFGYRGEEDSYNYGRLEPRPTYSHSLDEMGICEGLFDYWPCMHRKDRISCSE